MEAALPEKPSSDAAMEGTAAHELAAHCLQRGTDPTTFIGRKINVRGTCTAEIFLAKGAPDGDGIYLVTEEMAGHVLEYVKLVRTTVEGPKGEMAVEARVYAKRIHETDVHGTADAIVYRPDEKVLHVFDLKYGRGVPVEAEGNNQGGIYLSGAWMRYHNRPIEKFVFHIFQPRCPHRDGPHRTMVLTAEEMEKGEIQLAVNASRVDEAEQVRDAMPADEWARQYLVPGDHCRFCNAAATCPARAQMALDTAKTEFGDTTALEAPDDMDPDKLGQVLRKARQIQHWIKAVEEHAAAEARAGRMPTGFKFVAGKTTRAWEDEQKLTRALPLFCSVSLKDLYEAPKLLSPAKLEKLLPAAERGSLAPFIQKRQGGVLLVPDDDPRPAARPDAAEEFSDTTEQE